MSKTLKLSEFAPAELKPRFESRADGVYHIALETDREGNTRDKAPVRLSDAIRLIGRGTDSAGSHYRVFEYTDRITRQKKAAVLPMADIGERACWQRLQSMGITVQAGRRKRELLADYLQTEGGNTVYSVTDSAGWHEGQYILPDGSTIGQGGKVIYNGDKSQAAAYQASGSLAEWQSEIAAYAAGNSRLCLALGTAFAAPLLSLLQMESGGFHLYGDSSDGKTTAARVALSVWASPERSLMTWQGTKLGFNNVAAARNDGLLVLDEIGQANPHVIGDTVYSIMNGVNKAQGAKDGGNRVQSRWRVLVLSTGEKTPDSILHSKGEWNAGQNTRLPSIPANAGQGCGVYDTLHGFHDGAALSEHLADAAALYHGEAGRAFIELINPAVIAQAKDAVAAVLAEMQPVSGQARRVAKRFALAAAALELAAPVTGLPAGVGIDGVIRCFDDWLAINGTGKLEDERITRQAMDFMQMHGNGERFTDVKDTSAYTNRNHAGYKKRADDAARDEYLIIPAVFESEICGSFEPVKVCTVLHGIGWLLKPAKGRWRHQQWGLPGRYYVLRGMEPPEHTDTD